MEKTKVRNAKRVYMKITPLVKILCVDCEIWYDAPINVEAFKCPNCHSDYPGNQIPSDMVITIVTAAVNAEEWDLTQ